MAERVKALVPKPDGLSTNLGSHIVEGKHPQACNLSSALHMHTVAHEHPPHTYKASE